VCHILLSAKKKKVLGRYYKEIIEMHVKSDFLWFYFNWNWDSFSSIKNM